MPTNAPASLTRTDTGSEVTRAAESDVSTSLPPELLAEASRRLGWAGLIYSCSYFVAYFGPHLIAWLTVPGYSFIRVQNWFAVVSVTLGLAVFVLSRRSWFSPAHLLDIGLVFQVAGAAGIAVAEFWNGFMPVDVMRNRYSGIPWECAWILIFPLIAPNTPRKMLVAAIASASMGPVVVAITGALGTPLGRSPLMIATLFLFTTYLCAGLAYLLGRIVYGYGVRLKKAREFGSYELVTKLGEGGMGEVWVARHRMLARPAAVKLVRPEFLGPDARTREIAARRFEREAMATAALRSTHTIDVYDFGITEDGSFFYVMEFLEGLTLDAMVRRFGPVSPGRAVYLLRQICHSLGEAHARGLVHRDIKPANIFSARLGPDCDFIKVLDFGLVKHTVDLSDASGLTGMGTTTGTPAYMAPEVALARDVDARTDIYGVGCVAYWLLTGDVVFKRESSLATILAHVRDAPVPPSARSELAIPAGLNQLVLECLAKDPASRPQTMVELARRLNAIDVEPWTADDARKWWAMHGPLGTVSAVTGQDLTPAGVVYARR